MNKADEQKKAWEKKIFDLFILASGLEVDHGSVSQPLENSVTPTPDIRCLVGGEAYFFELTEAVPTEQAEALGTKGVYQICFPDPTNQGVNALQKILAKKQSKEYLTDGSPIDLVLYFSKDFPIYISDIRPEELSKAFHRGKFSRIWLYDTWMNRILPIPR